MIGSSKNNIENYPTKCFWTPEKETRVKFNPGLSANQLSNNWAQAYFLETEYQSFPVQAPYLWFWRPRKYDDQSDDDDDDESKKCNQ